MSFPLISCNLAGSQLLSSTDLGLPSSLSSAQSVDSTGFSTGVPASVIVFGSMASGQATIKTKVGTSATMSMASGTTDKAIPAAGSNYNKIDTTTTNLFARVRLTDANWSSAFTDLTALVVYGLTAGEDHFSVRTGHKAVSSTIIGDGSGVVSMSPA